MASLLDRVPANIAGKYYVDTTCIDCDQCRSVAPDLFGRTEDGFSYVKRQPVTPEELAAAEEAASGCATASIGNDGE